MAYSSLPPAGSTDWYSHYADLDRATSGVVQLDSFPGANDDAKLTAALSYAAAQTYIPWVQFPGGRRVTLSQTGRTPFSGMKLMGPGSGAVASMNREVSDGKLLSHSVRVNAGTGSSAWFVGSGTIHGVSIANIAFESSNGNTQWWHQPLSGGNGLYACNFHNLTFFGFKHVIGMPTNAAAFTQVVTSGHWQCISPFDTQFSLRGSDNQLWMGAGMLNIHGMRTDVPGSDLILLSGVKKTQVGYIYLTAQEAAWAGVRVTGSSSVGLNFFGGSYEGRNASTQASGRLFRIDNGAVGFYGTWFAFGQKNDNHNGIVEVTGGNVYMDRPVYDRGNTSNTVPFIHQTGGHLTVRGAYGALGTPRVASTGGTRDLDSTVTEA